MRTLAVAAALAAVLAALPAVAAADATLPDVGTAGNECDGRDTACSAGRWCVNGRCVNPPPGALPETEKPTLFGDLRDPFHDHDQDPHCCSAGECRNDRLCVNNRCQSPTPEQWADFRRREAAAARSARKRSGGDGTSERTTARSERRRAPRSAAAVRDAIRDLKDPFDRN